MLKRTLLITGFIFLTTLGFSQENTQSFTLQEAIDFALKNNRAVKNAERDIEIAKQQKKETITTGLPQIDGKVDYLYNIKQQFEPTDFDGDGIPEFGARQSLTPSATLTQLIFDGTYLVGLQSAKVFLEISENAKKKTDLEIRKAVINAYGNVLLSEESILILNKNIDVLEQTLNETSKIYEEGLGEEESVEQLQITLSEVRSNKSNVERLRTIAYKVLNITLGIDANSNTSVTDTLESLTVENMSLNALNVENDIENNIDYLIASNDVRAKELLIKLERFRRLPSINGFLTGSYIGNSQDFSFLSRDQKYIGTAAFGATLSIPIFSSGRSQARVQEAKIDLEKSKENLTETQQQLKLQIASAKSQYQFTIEDYQNKKESLALAERIEKKNQTKFFEGIGSSFELQQAQTQLYTAQQNYLQSMLDVINAKAELDRILNK